MNTGIPAIDDSTAPFVVGSDEVGYGAWAGPVMVAAVAVPRDWKPPVGLTDSKKMSASSMRRVRSEFLTGTAGTWWAIEQASPAEIDEAGVHRVVYALHEKLLRAAAAWSREAAGGAEPLVIVDGGIAIEGSIALPKADLLVPAVSMASVLAKLARDEHMAERDREYPGYGFAAHVGYGTPTHQEALARLGPCALHRRSYAPIAELVRAVEEPREAWLGLEEEDDPTG